MIKVLLCSPVSMAACPFLILEGSLQSSYKNYKYCLGTKAARPRVWNLQLIVGRGYVKLFMWGGSCHLPQTYVIINQWSISGGHTTHIRN